MLTLPHPLHLAALQVGEGKPAHPPKAVLENPSISVVGVDQEYGLVVIVDQEEDHGTTRSGELVTAKSGLGQSLHTLRGK